jgi:hypothetical protein
MTSVHPLGGKELRALRRLQREMPEGARTVHIFVSERLAPLSVAGYQRMVARAGGLLASRFSSTATCCGTAAATSWPMTGTIRARSNTISATDRSRRRCGIRRWRPIGSRGSGRTEMPTKRGIKGSPAKPTTTYAEWKARCAALLEGQGMSAGFMREKEWRRLFIQGSPPEDAVRHAGTFYHNSRPFLERTRPKAMTEDLPFKVVRSNGTDEVLARAMNLLVARATYREAARLYPEDLIELRQGARVIEKSR